VVDSDPDVAHNIAALFVITFIYGWNSTLAAADDQDVSYYTVIHGHSGMARASFSSRNGTSSWRP